MLGSTNHFFNQPKQVVENKRRDVYSLLILKGYNREATAVYLKAYDYFTSNPHDFDGATVVKDLCDIPDLDLDAMLHDYQYLIHNVASSVSIKWKADWLYAKGQERKGKGLYGYYRFFGLTILSIGFVPYARVSRGRITKEQIEQFLKEYQVLINKP